MEPGSQSNPGNPSDNATPGSDSPAENTDPAENTRPTATDWNALFEGQKPPDPKQIRTLVLELHQQERFEEVIALIEQAIVHGQIQPWMYEVLALTMETVGRPRAQIARVLMSSRDLIDNDSDSILYLAAYLTRYERHEQALKLYRQVSLLDPLRVESYVMGLELAEILQDPSAVAWTTTGILTCAWGKDWQDQHRRAELLAEQTMQQLRDAGRELEATALDQLLIAARQHDMHVILDWNGNGDLDLEVIDPLRVSCTSRDSATPGGVLHIRSGEGPRQENCVEEVMVPIGLSGEYRLVVKHRGGDIVGKRARLTIVRYEGSPREVRQTQTIPLNAEGQTIRVMLKEGRLNAPLAIPVPPRNSTSFKPSRSANVQSLQSATPGPALPGRANGLSSAVGFQPVVQVIPSGVQLSTLALVSADRRYVRLSLAPVFSNVSDVFTYSFTGGATGNAGGGTF